VADDTPDVANTGITQADALYRGFPDFSAWSQLSPSDTDLWNRFAASLEERRNAATPEALQAAVEVAVRAAALDTGAIEGLYTVDRGFTMTVAVQGLAWEQMIEERGAGVRELFEAQLEAYELVLDAVTRKLPITEAWIRALHEKLCAPQKTYRVLTDAGWQEQDLPKGQYKTRPNHVRLTDGTYHAYAPVDQVATEMYRLIEQIRTPEFEAAHPVLQASYCHYAFVVIHPFADGNGRVARALASTFFYRAQSVPLVIFSNQRPAYLDALHAADLGDLRPVISFFRDRGIDTMQLIAEGLLTSEMPLSGPVLSELSKRAASLALSSKQMDTIGYRLLEKVAESLGSGLKDLVPAGNAISRIIPTTDRELPTSGYRQSARPLFPARNLLVVLPSLGVHAGMDFRVLPATDPLNPFGFSIETIGSSDRLEVRLADVHPEISESFRLRLESWVRRQLGKLLNELEERSRPARRESDQD
jgi:Fic family protein